MPQAEEGVAAGSVGAKSDDGSTVLLEVASDSSTYRYFIEATGENGSMAVVKDIAHLLLAAEQSLERVKKYKKY